MATPEIIIPIFNAFIETQLCLESVFKFSPAHTRVILVNDCSDDPRMAPFLIAIGKSQPFVTVVSTPTNSGFVAAVNLGLECTTQDVVILNSDTIVTRGWLTRLVRCLSSAPKIGIVCPVSNHGWILSIPRNDFENPIPHGWSLDSFAALVARKSPRNYPEIPCAVGLCMLISRKVIEAIGNFEMAFSPGYGEEVDYSFRAKQAGFEIRCADDAYIYHKGSSSFGRGDLRQKCITRHVKLLNVFWPNYERDLHHFIRSKPFSTLLDNLGL